MNNFTTTQLKEIVAQYPYFSVAQIQYAQKLYQENAQELPEILSKMTLFEPNYFWLHYLLNREKYQQNLTVEDTKIASKLHAVLAAQMEDFKKPVEAQASVLQQETVPLYKIDYFKYQGVKVEDLPDTQFGTQVKKFTDWLKVVKARGYAASGNQEVLVDEEKIAKQAQTSLINPNIHTEAMAEVLILQGYYSQAISLYEKLSLSIPEKNTYFANKIKLLKEKIS